MQQVGLLLRIISLKCPWPYRPVCCALPPQSHLITDTEKMLISGDAIETLRPVCRLANDGEEAEYSRQVFNPQAIRILAKRRKGCNTCHVRKIKVRLALEPSSRTVVDMDVLTLSV